VALPLFDFSHRKPPTERAPRLSFASAALSDLESSSVSSFSGTNEDNRDGGTRPASQQKAASMSVERFLDQLDFLPAVDRARLAFNHFASTLLEIDVDGDGTKERVFVTVEFPLIRLSLENI
jgi:hypothetical protein